MPASLPTTARVVFVTGGAKRIGAAICTVLHTAGWHVVIHCNRSRDQADVLAASFNGLRPGSAAVVQGDLLAYNALKGLVAQAHSCFGRLDGLINNASSFRATPMGSIDEDDWHELMGSNLKAPLFLSQAAAPALRATGGAIVNIVDIHAERPLKRFALYSAAKAGLAGLTRALAMELAPEVRVNAVAPGAIVWPEQADDFPPPERQRILEQVPLQREGKAADIADAVRYLLLDASYVTGAILPVDGGRLNWI